MRNIRKGAKQTKESDLYPYKFDLYIGRKAIKKDFTMDAMNLGNLKFLVKNTLIPMTLEIHLKKIK